MARERTRGGPARADREGLRRQVKHPYITRQDPAGAEEPRAPAPEQGEAQPARGEESPAPRSRERD